MEYVRARRISLKSHAQYDESWLQTRIQEDPSLLGLPGDLRVHQVQRTQPSGGRLDLILVDDARKPFLRYEVEIQLGATDPSHIIRTIEYWDVERKRYPQYEHVAVLIAEDVTSRFLNVIGLFNDSIPLIAIQLNALEVGNHLTINATTVLDLQLRGTDEEDQPGDPVDRHYWDSRSSAGSMALMDSLFDLVRTTLGLDGLTLKYNKAYIGLARSGVADNIVGFNPRKVSDTVLTTFRMPLTEELKARLEDAEFDIATGYRPDRTRIRLTAQDLQKRESMLRELIRTSADLPPEDARPPGVDSAELVD